MLSVFLQQEEENRIADVDLVSVPHLLLLDRDAIDQGAVAASQIADGNLFAAGDQRRSAGATRAGSGAQRWFDESRPMDTSPAGKEKAVPFKGPPIPTSLGFVSAILRCLAQIGLPCTRCVGLALSGQACPVTVRTLAEDTLIRELRKSLTGWRIARQGQEIPTQTDHRGHCINPTDSSRSNTWVSGTSYSDLADLIREVIERQRQVNQSVAESKRSDCADPELWHATCNQHSVNGPSKRLRRVSIEDEEIL